MKRKLINNKLRARTSEEEVSSDDHQITEGESEGDGDNFGDNESEAIDEDLGVSDTDSDENNVTDDSNDEDKSNQVEENKPKNEKIKDQILQRYEERHGKQLYIRFPHKIPDTQESLEEKIRELAPLYINVHKPRQRHVRFCLVDFATKEDRNSTLNKLKKSIKKGELKKYVVSIPRTESIDFVKDLCERKVKSLENKKAKLRLKKATKKSLKENKFTSTVVVLNLPKSTSTAQIRKLFTNAVDINIKICKGKLNKDKITAAVTFPTTMDARNATKRKLSLGGNQLFIKFDNRLKTNLKSGHLTKPKQTK